MLRPCSPPGFPGPVRNHSEQLSGFPGLTTHLQQNGIRVFLALLPHRHSGFPGLTSSSRDTWVFLALYPGTRVFLARHLTMATLGFPGPQSGLGTSYLSSPEFSWLGLYLGCFDPLFPRVFLARFVKRDRAPRVFLARSVTH